MFSFFFSTWQFLTGNKNRHRHTMIWFFYIKKKQSAKKEKIVNKMSIFKLQTSPSLNRSADDVPWTLNIKRDKRDPFLIFWRIFAVSCVMWQCIYQGRRKVWKSVCGGRGRCVVIWWAKSSPLNEIVKIWRGRDRPSDPPPVPTALLMYKDGRREFLGNFVHEN